MSYTISLVNTVPMNVNNYLILVQMSASNQSQNNSESERDIDDLIPASFVFAPRYRSSVNLVTEKNITESSPGKMEYSKNPKNDDNISVNQVMKSRYYQSPNYDLLNDHHYQLVQEFRILYLSGRKKLTDPRTENYCSMVRYICCPVLKLISFTSIWLLLYIAEFIVEVILGLNKDGTFLEIQVDVLISMGANKPLLVKQGGVWRLLVASFLHADFNHLFGNFVLTLMLLSHIQYTIGRMRSLLLYLISAVGANIFSALIEPTKVKLGSSTCLFGALGLSVGYFILNYRGLNEIGTILKRQLGCITFITLIFVGVLSSIGQRADHFGHLGGLMTGVWCSCLCNPIVSKKREKAIRIIFGIILVAQLLLTFTLFFTILEEQDFEAEVQMEQN